jgi:hypothetical protein
LARRQALRTLSLAVLAGALLGCAQGASEPWQPPDWWRSKRGSNQKGGDRG